MGQIFGSDGQRRFSEFQINTTASSGFAVPQVIAMSDGGFMTVWRQFSFQGSSSDGSSYGIYGQRFDSNGRRLGSEIQLNTSTSGGQSNPSVAQLNNGNLISVWHGPGDGDSGGIIKQRFDTSGTTTTSISTTIKTTAANNSTTGTTTSTSSTAEEIPEISLTTRSGASLNLTSIDTALETLNSQRASLGALSNRIDHIVANNTNTATYIAKSISRIEDADFAAETSNLAKQQILQQAATSMLAQANASKQNILTLLNL